MLSFFGLSWASTMAKEDSPMWAKLMAVFIVGGLMYMSGVFTHLWGVYK
jgi:hypothetical protein